jgi:hypothetical protein
MLVRLFFSQLFSSVNQGTWCAAELCNIFSITLHHLSDGECIDYYSLAFYVVQQHGVVQQDHHVTYEGNMKITEKIGEKLHYNVLRGKVVFADNFSGVN